MPTQEHHFLVDTRQDCSLARMFCVFVSVVCPATSIADVTLHYSPTILNVGETVDLTISLTSNPGTSESVGAISFDYDDSSDAWNALNPSSFTWVPDIMHDPNLWFITESLPFPQAAAFEPSDSISIPDCGSIIFATLTVTPLQEGVWELATGASVFNEDAVSLNVKGGDPVQLTVVGSGADCCFNNGTPGCSDQACQDCVCALDPFCCSDFWDDFCAACAAGTGGNTTCQAVGDCPAACQQCDVCGNGFCSPDEDCATCPEDCGPGSCVADFDGDGDVDAADLAVLLAAWGPCLP